MSSDRETAAAAMPRIYGLLDEFEAASRERPTDYTRHVPGTVAEERYQSARAAVLREQAVAALHHPADEKAASRAPVGLVDGELAELSRKAIARVIVGAMQFKEFGHRATQEEIDEHPEGFAEVGDFVSTVGGIELLQRSAEEAADGILALASSTQPEAAGQATADQILWAVHVRGPDDVVAVQSYDDAVRLSDGLNWWWAAQTLTENDPIISAVPIIYDGKPERHAEDVAKLGTRGYDYGIPTEEQVARKLWVAVNKRIAAAQRESAAPKATAQAGDALGGVDVALKEVERLTEALFVARQDAALPFMSPSIGKHRLDAFKEAKQVWGAAIRALSPQSAPLGREDAEVGQVPVGNMIAEDEQARKEFDRETSTMFGGSPMARIAALLTTAYHMAPEHGSYRKLMAICANECAKVAALQPPTDKAGAAVGDLDAVVDAAREWLTDRTLDDPASRALGLALMEAFPGDRNVKDNCPCGENAKCEECPTDAEWEAGLANLRTTVGEDKAKEKAWREAMKSPHPDDGSVKGQDQGGGRG